MIYEFTPIFKSKQLKHCALESEWGPFSRQKRGASWVFIVKGAKLPPLAPLNLKLAFDWCSRSINFSFEYWSHKKASQWPGQARPSGITLQTRNLGPKKQFILSSDQSKYSWKLDLNSFRKKKVLFMKNK